MSQSGFTPIQLYRTSTAAAVPTAGNLAAGELAINLTDEALYFKNAAGVVKLLADSSGALGTVTSVDVSGGTTGLTTSGGPITSSGTITLAGTLGVANGGTGTATAFTAGSVVFAGASGVYTQDNANLFWDNTNDRLGIGTATPVTRLHVSQSNSGDYASVVLLSNSADAAADRTGIYGSPAPGTANPYRGGITFWPGSTGAVSIHTGNNATPGAGERVRIDGTNGNVGIGTSSPAERLDVAGNAKITSGSSFYWGDATSQITAVNGGAMRFLVGNGGEKVRIDASGNVGIGTTTTTAYFTNYTSVRNSGVSGAALGLEVGGQPRLLSAADNSSSYISSYDDNPIVFSVTSGNFAGSTGTERARIDSNGNLLVGGTTAFNSTAGRGNIGIDGASSILNFGNSGASSAYIFSTSASLEINAIGSRFLQFTTNSAERMRIDSSGNVGIGGSSPGTKFYVNGGVAIHGASFPTSGVGIEALWDGTQSVIQSYNRNVATYQPLRLDGSALQLFTSGTEKARITSSGTLLINESAQISYGGNVPKLEVLGASVASTDADGGTVGVIGSTNTAGAGGALVLGSLFQTGAWATFARVRASKDTATSGEYGGGLAFDTRPNLGNLTQRMLITSSGDVAIGTTGLAYSFTGRRVLGIDGTDSSLIEMRSGGTQRGYIIGDANTIKVAAAGSNTLQFETNGAERMRIDTSGNVGIGTSAPGQKLDVSVAGGNNFAGIRSQNSNTGTGIAGIEFSSDATYSKAAIGLLRQNANGQGSLVFYNASSTGAANWSTADERMRIDSSGNLLVGTTSGTGGIAGTAPRLVVEPPNTSTHGVILKSLGQSYDVGLIWNTAASGDNKFFEFGTDATYTARGSINYNRTAGLVAYNTTSDYRAKDIIGPLQDTGATIDALKVYNGKMKGATIARPMLVAHEAQEVVPYAVTGQKDAVNEDGTDKYQQMDHQSFIPLLIAEIQSLRARVAQLEGN